MAAAAAHTYVASYVLFAAVFLAENPVPTRYVVTIHGLTIAL